MIDFADHEKNATLVESSDRRIDAMSKAMAVDFALHQGVYRWNDDIPAQLAAMKKNGVTTVKLFTTYKNVGYMIDREADTPRVVLRLQGTSAASQRTLRRRCLDPGDQRKLERRL